MIGVGSGCGISYRAFTNRRPSKAVWIEVDDSSSSSGVAGMHPSTQGDNSGGSRGLLPPPPNPKKESSHLHERVVTTYALASTRVVMVLWHWCKKE